MRENSEYIWKWFNACKDNVQEAKQNKKDHRMSMFSRSRSPNKVPKTEQQSNKSKKEQTIIFNGNQTSPHFKVGELDSEQIQLRELSNKNAGWGSQNKSAKR